MRKARYLVLFMVIVLPAFVGAQEFMCQVSINTPQVEGTEKKIFQTLQTQLYEFINNRKWTNYIYKTEERLECSMMITVTERVSSDQFKARVNVVLKRPVYKTSYSTDLLNLVDKDFDFKYVELEPLEYNDDAYTSNLTSMVAYYLYIMLAVDADSFTKFGGTPFYEKARAVVNSAQNSPDRGWKAFESQKNRYWLVENLMNNTYSAYREGLYSYHRMGLDLMSDNMDLGRSGINDCLEDVQKVNREKTGLYITQLFIDAKKDELINIYSQASPMDKTKAINVLKEIDPANSSKYQQIMQTSK
jgi:hypothetical protein